MRPSRAIEELYHSVLEAKRTHKLTNCLNIRELSFFGRKQELSQLEEYLSLVETGEAVGPFLVMGQSGTGKKRLLRQLVLMYNRSFNFIKVEGRASSQSYEGSSWNDLRQALEKLGDEMGISLLEEEDDLILYGISFRALAKKNRS